MSPPDDLRGPTSNKTYMISKPTTKTLLGAFIVMMSLRLATFNSNGLGAGLPEYIRESIASVNCDLFLIQEHWLLEEQLCKLKNMIGKDYMIHGQSGMDSRVLLQGRPYGGTAIAWHSGIEAKVTPIPWVSKRVCAIKLFYSSLDAELLLINVYMPTDGGGPENTREYSEVLQEISAIKESNNARFIFIGGDLNTDMSRLNSPHTVMLRQFLEEENLNLAQTHRSSTADYTYESRATGGRSLIDHFLVSDNVYELITVYDAEHKAYNPSDHSCLFMSVDLPAPNIAEEMIEDNKVKMRWDKATAADIDRYQALLDNFLRQIDIPVDALACRDLQCNGHIEEMESFHDSIVNACLMASREAIPTHNTGQPKGRAGWNNEVNEHKQRAIFWHNLWKENGKPRNGVVADIRRRTRALYHLEVKKVKKNQDRISANNLASKKNVWAEVKKIKGSSNSVPNTMDNKVGSEEIGKLFADKFKKLYNSVSFERAEMRELELDIGKEITNSCCKGKCYSNHRIIQEDVKEGIKHLNRGKQDGIPDLFTDHYINGGGRLEVYIGLLLNSMVIHGYCPTEFERTRVIPIPKDNKKSLNSSDNYRGISLSSVLGKILDNIILKNHSEGLSPHDAQFGFKKNLSTANCAAVVQEVIGYYNERRSPVYCVTLDASKAFDCVHFIKLFRQLLKKGLCPLMARFLAYQYSNQIICVKWGDYVSNVFTATNGVKQGGVLSPILFNVYLDQLLIDLQQSKVGCRIGHLYTGVFAYADDVILLAPTVFALTKMLKIARLFSKDYMITFNMTKSGFMVFGRGLDVHVEYVIFDGVRLVAKESDKHLGFPLGPNIDKFRIDVGINDLYRRTNMVMAFFGHASAERRYFLFKTFCMSMYGFQFWDMTSRHIQNLFIAWRKCVRRIMKLPVRTHNNLIPLIIDDMGIEFQMEKRLVRFIENMTKSENQYMQLCRQLIVSDSGTCLGRNVTNICTKYQLVKCRLGTGGTLIPGEVHDNENVRVAAQVRELVQMRENGIHELLTPGEITDMLEFICTT